MEMQIVVCIIIFSLVFVVSSHERAHYPLCVHFNDRTLFLVSVVIYR